MIVLISSKQLKKELSIIDFENEQVENVLIHKDLLKIITNIRNIEIDCITNASVGIEINQSDSNWKWVYQAVRSLPEQPITLEIDKDYLRMVLNFRS
jgi:hypothetical protein